MADPDPRLTWITEGAYTKSPLEFNFEEQIAQLRDLTSGDFMLVATLFDTQDAHMYSLTQEVQLQTDVVAADETVHEATVEMEEEASLGEGATAHFVSSRAEVAVATPAALADEFFTATVKVVSSRLAHYRLDVFLVPGEKADVSLTPLSSLSFDLARELRKSETTVFERDILFEKVRFASEHLGGQFSCYLRLFDKDDKKYVYGVAEDSVTFTVGGSLPSSEISFGLASDLPAGLAVDVDHAPEGFDALILYYGFDPVDLPFRVLAQDPTQYVLGTVLENVDSSGKTFEISRLPLRFPYVFPLDAALFSIETPAAVLTCSLAALRPDGVVDHNILATRKYFIAHQATQAPEEKIPAAETFLEPLHLTITSPVDTSRVALGGAQMLSGELPLIDCDLAIDPTTVPRSCIVYWYLVKETKIRDAAHVQHLLTSGKCFPLLDHQGHPLEGVLISGWDCDYRQVFGKSLLGVPTTFTLLCVAYSNRSSGEIVGWGAIVLTDPLPSLPRLSVSIHNAERTLQSGVYHVPQKVGTYNLATLSFSHGEHPLVVEVASRELDATDLNYVLTLVGDDQGTDFSLFSPFQVTFARFTHSDSYRFFDTRRDSSSGAFLNAPTGLLFSLFRSGSFRLQFALLPQWGDQNLSLWRTSTAPTFTLHFSSVVVGQLPLNYIEATSAPSVSPTMLGPEAPFTLDLGPVEDGGVLYLSDAGDSS